MGALADIHLIVCGIVRDAARGLRHNIPEVERLCRAVGDYRIFLYENDSRDGTKEILTRWQQRDPGRIHISLNDTDPTKTIPRAEAVTCNPFYSYRRIDKMARLRNRYMEYVDAAGWTADCLMVVDMDVAQLRAEGVIDSLQSPRPWDAIVANGYSTSPRLCRRYHDSYALTLWGDEGRPQTEQKIRQWAHVLGRLRRGDDWLRVASGFGGVALYRWEAVRGVRYRALPNDDDRVEVKCEHFSLYEQMRLRGYDRFYLNPSMELKYQRLSLQIVWRSLMRRLGR